MNAEASPDVRGSTPERRPTIRSALFEIATEEPNHAPQWVVRAVGVLFAVLCVWAVFAELDIVADAQGRLIPQTYVKIVQPADAGLVREILVTEGDLVEEGQVLARLDPTMSAANVKAIEHDLAVQQLQLRRFESELGDNPMTSANGDDAALFAQVRAQREAHRREFTESVAGEKAARDRASKELKAAQQLLEKLEKTLPSYQRSAAAYEELVGRQLVSALLAEEKTREALEKAQDLEVQRATVASLEAAVEESVRRLQQVTAAYENGLHSDRIAAVVRIGQLEQDLVRAKFQQEHLELRAPQAGIVKELSTTTIGAVVQPGTVLLSLVPAEEPLLAEVLIENKDIGFVRSGQTVRLKLDTYPFQKYGMLQGVVQTVSADSQSGGWQGSASQSREQLERSGQALTFKAVVQLLDQHLLIDGASLPLAAGMQLHAEIVEGRRTVLEYLLSPLRRVVSEAGQER
jgi:HlyD family secretion protein